MVQRPLQFFGPGQDQEVYHYGLCDSWRGAPSVYHTVFRFVNRKREDIYEIVIKIINKFEVGIFGQD